MPSRLAIEHEQMRWAYMNMVDLSRRITKMTKRDKLDAFLHYASEVWAGREPSMCGSRAARDLILNAIERCNILGFRDLTSQYTARFQMDSGASRPHSPTPPIRRVIASDTGRYSSPTSIATPTQVTDQRGWESDRVRNTVNVLQSAWPSGTTSTFIQLMNPNMRHSIFEVEESRRPLITAMWNFFQGVALGTIHSAERRITRSESVDLMGRLRDVAELWGHFDLQLAMARDVIRCLEVVTQWETTQRLEAERILTEAATATRQRLGLRLIRFPKKKEVEDTNPRQPTIDELLGLDEDDW